MKGHFNIEGLVAKQGPVLIGASGLWPRACTGAAVALVSLFAVPTDRALAACTPAAADNVAAICTEVTVNQGDGPPGTSAGANGYGNLLFFNLNVTVLPGASIIATGLGNGISLASGTVINAGTISANQVGIFADNIGVNVINSGTIISANANGIGARAVNLFNTGTITGGANGVGALNANIVNAGAITGVLGGIAVFQGAMTIVNAGTISGGATAISTTASNPDTLTLLPGSRLVGALVFGGGGDTINFRVGNQNLTFDTLVGATVTSTVPFAVAGNRVATIDPTSFVAAGTKLGDFSRAISTAVPVSDSLPAAGGAATTAFAAQDSPASIVSSAFDHMPGLSAYAADRVAFKAPTMTYADGTTFWARGFIGERTQQADGVVLRNVSNFFGGVMGMDKRVAPNLRVGAFVGAGSTRSSFDLNSGSTDSNLGFGGLFAHYHWGASFLRAAVQGGGSSNDSTRNINNNLAPNGFEIAQASYSGWYVSPELTVGRHIALGNFFGAQHTLTPSVQVRYLYGSFGGYTETGSTANLTVDGQTVQTLEERAELRLVRSTLLSPATALSIQVTGGALAMQRVGGNSVGAVLLGQAIPFATPGRNDSWGGYGSFGMELRHANVAVFGSAEYLALNDDSGVISGKAGLRIVY